jgi:hypothetical protein
VKPSHALRISLPGWVPETLDFPDLAGAMDRTGEYRLKATSCLSLAQRMTQGARRSRLLDYALYWFRLAELADKNHGLDLVYEWPPRPENRDSRAAKQPKPQGRGA